MARLFRTRSVALRLITLIGLALVVHHLSGGPAYAVKGSWEPESVDLKELSKGHLGALLQPLEPNVSLPTLGYRRGGLRLVADDGHLSADYSSKFGDDTALDVHVDDEKAWRATLKGDNSWLRVRGAGLELDKLSWEASQASSVEDVGDLLLHYDSKGKYNLTLVKELLAEISGAEVGAHVTATNDGLSGRLEARRNLGGKAQGTYSVQNTLGEYDMTKATHTGIVTTPLGHGQASIKLTQDATTSGVYGSYGQDLAGGQVDLQLSREGAAFGQNGTRKGSALGSALGYNVSFARSLDDKLHIDSRILVGADEAGVYGKLTAGRDVSDGV
eukprot:CAMPEP_0170589652 /NCGR_PEP_ID=MMETSP0224-20130122/11459_1 /TAXON_ID=285029 /ORGANISM="Togula jolla, Strain CCCM 725" /LENGTH=329 /DNA_ID=CAMNT_0010913413 /DNA_START=56 /DNA_END=1042 /DNA_ORIENTATION=+